MNEIGQLTLRDATPEDAPTLLRILREAFDEYKNVLEPPSGAHAETLDTVRRHLADGAAVLASIDREPVGFGFYEPAGPVVYFSRLSVLPRFRNNGIGRALLEHVERRAKETGAAGVRLGVRLQLPHLLARYERVGYRIAEYKTHDGYAHPTYVYMDKLWRAEFED
ncbi:MAG: GNAT family N-acetyltransferase [Acidobacteria bacterium]|nr:MAG: GNAT family N-acetyltransferase [Acidobacteriota bacterium]